MVPWPLVVSGALVGLMVGLTGVGGGALMTPLLLLFFGVAPMTAVGTDLWFAAITKLVATPVYHRDGLIDWPVVKRLWTGSLTTSALTLAWLHYHPATGHGMRFVTAALAVTILLTVVAMAFQRRLHGLGQRLRLTQVDTFKGAQRPLTYAAGALLGLLVTITSVGAGALGAVFLLYLYPLRLTPPRLVATDIVHAIPLALFAGAGHLLLGHVDLAMLGWLLLGSLPAVVLGALLSARMPHRVLRGALMVVLVLVAIKLLTGASA